jgi:internalin A
VRRSLGPDFIDTVALADLRGTQCDDGSLRAACRLPWLEELTVSNTVVTDAGAEDLRQLKKLRSLDLTLNKFTGRPLRHIGGMTELRELKLAMRLSPVPLRDEDMEFLKGLTKLESLTLPSKDLTDAWLVYIEELTSLKSLQLYGMAITTAGLRHLRGLTNLTVLSLHGTRVDDLEVLRPLTKIGYLCIAYTPAGDSALASLRGWPRLYSLDLRKTNVTDAGLLALGGLPALREVNLSQTKVTDAGLKHLAGLKSLRLVRVEGTDVTDAGVEEFSKVNPTVTVIR